MTETPEGRYFPISSAPIDIDWDSEGDELLEYVQRYIMERVPHDTWGFGTHSPTKEEPGFYYEFFPGWGSGPPRLRSRLCMVPGKTGMHAFVYVDDIVSNSGDVGLWKAALDDAVEHIKARNPHPCHDWWAVIADTVGGSGGSPQKLESNLSIGGLQVQVGSSPYFDALRPYMPSMSSLRVGARYPAVVRGTALGYDWDIASDVADRDLSRLCAMLSVAFGHYWTVLQAPQEGDIDIKVLPTHRFSKLSNQTTEYGEPQIVTVPEWLNDDAWTRVANDTVLSTALHAYHQAIAMEESFPSFSMVAYVSCIEGLGAKVEPLRRCDCCDKCNATIGAVRRFRKALKLVLPSRDARQLAEIYGPRSDTVHRGTLHADELIYGIQGGFRIFTPWPALDFRYTNLANLRQACRLLLRRFMSEPAAQEESPGDDTPANEPSKQPTPLDTPTSTP